MRGPGYLSTSVALALMLAAPIGAFADPHEPDAITAAPPATRADPPAAAAAAKSAAQAESPAPAKESPASAQPAASAPAPTAPAVSEAPAQAKDAAPAPAAAVAAEQAAPPDPLASLDPADRAVAEKIRDLFLGKADKIFAGKKERAAIEAFYQRRNLLPLWLDKGIENARAKAVAARLKQADADGLETADYRAPNFAGLSAEALAEAELKLTETVLTFARHLQAGRFPYPRVSNNIELPQAPPDTLRPMSNMTPSLLTR